MSDAPLLPPAPFRADLPPLIVHAGFHKTGTSSVQRMLDKGRGPLGRVARVLLKKDMTGMTEAARAYAARPEPLELSLFAYEVAQVFEGLSPTDPRRVILSSEDLAGHIPGRRGRMGYPHAARLMATLIDTASQVWDGRPEVRLYFSTRAAGAWIRSCYAQHLRATRMTDDEGAYAEWQATRADLAAEADAVARALPGITVTHHPLEQTATLPNGPLTPLLDLADIPAKLRSRIRIVAPVNTALPPEIRAQLLALNRSDLPEAELRRAKEALIAGHAGG